MLDPLPHHRQRRLTFALGFLILVAAMVFAALYILGPPISTLNAQIAYTEIDRAGAIDVSKLPPAALDGKVALRHRISVPAYIAASANRAQRTNAFIGMCVCGANTMGLAMALKIGGRRRSSETN